MPTSLVVLDANILLEVLLAREKDKIARDYLANNSGGLAVSTLTAHLIVHFGQNIVSLTVLKQFLADYYLLELSYMDFDWAFNNTRSGDFEDALQLAVAIRNNCSQFVTFDEQLYKTYKNLPQINVTLLKK